MARPLRYSFILAGVALCAGLAAAGGWRYARASSPVNGPIILISIDSLRADHLPAYGYKQGHTPAIDTLAADGVVFEHAYAHSPQTLPSHASILSGRLPIDTGVRDDVGFAVKDSERLLAELLRDRGYATAAVVSTFALRKDSGIGQGFSLFDDKMAPAAPGSAVGETVRDAADSERAAEEWLGTAGTSRSFLFLQLNEPHAPYAVPPRFADLPPYDAALAHADEVLGRLLKYLKTHQLYDRSTILLTADHGEGLGAHGEQGHGLFVYDESLHVPLIVKQAAGESSGRRVADLVEHVDIVPTLLDLAKAPDPGGLRGQTLKPLLDGTGHVAGRVAYAESAFGRYHFGWNELTSATDGRYHYIRAPREELYDLTRDPQEAHNIVNDAPGAQALATLRAALDRLKPGALPPQAQVSAEDHERFDALGDVGRAGGDPAADAADPADAAAVLTAYRDAAQLAAARNWTKAIERLQAIARDHTEMSDLWREIGSLAFDAERYELSFDAYKHVIALEPTNAAPELAAAAALARLRRFDEARRHAEQAVALAEEKDTVSRAAAHEWLARIALSRRDASVARDEAGLAKAVDEKLPLPLFVDGRILYDQGHYAEAVEAFEQAAAEEKAAHSRPILDLHYYYADTLIRLQRAEDAERELTAELKAFPKNTRARAALATLQHSAGRDDDAAAAIADLVRITPTTDAYNTAARLWTTLGDRKQAADARAEANRLALATPSAAH